jgi:type I restriction enzyme S subunit
MSDAALPSGWEEVDGRELFDVVRGVTYSKSVAESEGGSRRVGIIRAGNLKDGRIDFEDLVYVPDHLVSEKQRLRTGDLVVAMSSGSESQVGKVAVADSDREDVSFGAFCAAVRPWSSKVAAWLRHFFQTRKYRALIASEAAGISINNLRREHLLALSIPLPPEGEIDRIVAKVDALQSRLQKAREGLDEIGPAINGLRRTLLIRLFRGELTEQWRRKAQCAQSGAALLERLRRTRKERWESSMPAGAQPRDHAAADKECVTERADAIGLDEMLFPLPETWCWAAAEEIVEPGAEIVYGIVQPGEHVPNGVPYVRAKDIQNGVIQLDQLRRTSKEIAKSYERAQLQGGDILLGIIRATKVAVVPEALAGGNITQGNARFRPSAVIRTGYLALWLDSPAAQEWLHARYRGIDMPGLNLRDVRRLPIPLPPLEEQDAIIRRLEEVTAPITSLSAAVQAALARCEELHKALLERAFNGELVPHVEGERPASTLLAELRQARDAAAAQDAMKKGGSIAMAKKTKVTSADATKEILEWLSKAGPERFTFDDLRREVPFEYELLKQAVFAMLGSKEPLLQQVFNTSERRMELSRSTR